MSLIDIDYNTLEKTNSAISRRHHGVVEIKTVLPGPATTGAMCYQTTNGNDEISVVKSRARYCSCIIKSRDATHRRKHDLSLRHYKIRICFAKQQLLNSGTMLDSFTTDMMKYSDSVRIINPEISKARKLVYTDEFNEHYRTGFPFHNLSKKEYHDLLLKHSRVKGEMLDRSTREATEGETVDEDSIYEIQKSTGVDETKAEEILIKITRDSFWENFEDICVSFYRIGFSD